MKERNSLLLSETNDKVKNLFAHWLDHTETLRKEKHCFVNRNDFDKRCMNRYRCQAAGTFLIA